MVRAVLAVLCFVTASAVASLASAGTIQPITQTAITRTNQTHPANINPMWISRSDCEAGDVFTFPVSLTYDSTETLQVWVGEAVDCTSAVNRGNGGVATCGLVYSNASPTAPTTTITLSDKQLLSGLFRSTEINPSPTCDVPSGVGNGPQPLSVYILLTTAGGATVTSSQYVDFIKFSLTGPDAPTNIGSGPGDSMLKVSWSQSTNTNVGGYYVFCEPLPVPTSITGGPVEGRVGRISQALEASVSEEGGDADDASSVEEAGYSALDTGPETDPGVALDAGTGDPGLTTDATARAGDDAGAEAATPTDASVSTGSAGETDAGEAADTGADDAADAGDAANVCRSSVIVQGTVPDSAFIKSYKCAQASGFATSSVFVDGLTDGRGYTVAVASYDVVGNVGPLSPPVCEGTTPTPVDGFFEAYRSNGGTAGGPGFCGIRNLGMDSARFGAKALLGAFLALGLVVARRRTRRR